MKTVVEKIILNYFGKFINGINRENLSVDLFKGNFQLENISLNQEYFDQLNTPFKLTYSSIGKLSLQAPISKLSSAPVECILDNIYAVFEFRASQTGLMQLSPDKILQEKKQSIEKYIRDMFEEYMKKLREKDEKKEDGMMAKLGKKIIDNLQLTIINVHVRFEENKGNQKYAWGVTLQEISFVTTDSQWKPTFIDRSAQGGKSDKLLKKMNLKNLIVYWQSGSKSINQPFISQLTTNALKAQSMSKMINNPRQSIISVTSEVKLIINNPDNVNMPQYELSVDLERIVFQLEKVQVSEMIDFTQKNISENEEILKNLSLKKKKSKRQLQPGQKVKLEQTFSDYVQNVLDAYEEAKQSKQKSKKDKEYEQMENLGILRTLLGKVEEDEMLVWALKPVRKKVKDAREKQLKKKNKSWFGGEYQLNEEQAKALNNFVEEVQEKDEKQRPASCLFFSIKTAIKGGKFSFVDNKNLPDEQRLAFEIGLIDLFLSKSADESLLDLTLSIESISLNLEMPVYGTEKRIKTNIIKNLQSDGVQFFDPGEESKFIMVKYSKRVEQEQTPVIKTDVVGELKQVVVTYKKLFLKKFKSFFTFRNFNQSIKNQTLKKWQQMTEKNEDKSFLSEEENKVVKMFNIQLKIISPLLVCPLTDLSGWCLNLGKMSIASNRDEQKQTYPMKIESAYFRYYPDLRICLKKMSEQQIKDKQIFSFVNDIDFGVTYVNYLYMKKQHTKLQLPNIFVNFNDSQYKNLISLRDIFESDESQTNFLQFLKKERMEVEKHKLFQGPILRKSEDLQKWKQFYGILSGQFIYLYGSEKQLKCLEKISFKNRRLEYDDKTKVIQLFSSEGITQLAGSQFSNNIKEWKQKILMQMKSFMTIYQIVEQMEESMSQSSQFSQTPRKRKDTATNIDTKRIKTVEFGLDSLQFSYKDEKNKELILFKLFGLKFQHAEQNKISTKKVSFKKMQVIDFVHIYKNPSLQILFATKEISIKIMRNKNDKQKKITIDFEIEDIYMNWKPDVLIHLLKLVYKYFSQEAKLRVDDGQGKTRNQLFDQVLKDPKFSFALEQYERASQGREVKDKRFNFVQKNKRLRELLKLNLVIKNTEILMVHRQSHLVMFKLIAKEIENELVIGENQKFVSGSIRTLQLYEMTGYPRENYPENSQSKPYLLIHPRDPNLQQPLIEYKWSSYEPYVLPNMQRVNSFMQVIINPIHCEYFQQITFRLIDYILIQIILLLNQPEMLVANENLLEQLKKTINVSEKEAKEQSQSIVKILYSKFDEVIRKIVDPYFMDMYFEIRRPSILLKSEKTSEIYHRAQLRDIIFSNEDRKNSARFLHSDCPQVLPYIYEQSYDIMCNNCSFFSVNQSLNKEHLLFEPVDILVTVNKLIMQDQINLIYPELSIYDRSFETSTRMSKLVIPQLTRQQYLLINKLVNFNIVFDDNKDQCFIHNYKLTKLLSPKPINYTLLIPQIELVGSEGSFDCSYNLFRLAMHEFKLTYNRNADLNSSFKIEINSANLLGYQFDFTDGKKGMLGGQQQSKSKVHELMEFKSKNQQNPCMDVTIKMKTSGEKIIEMNIQSIEAYLKLHLFQLIFQWSLLQDSVFPTVSIYANDITFHLTIHNMSAWLKQLLPEHSGSSTPRAFKLLGVFCYKFHRKANFSQQHLEQLLREKQIKINDINDMPEISYMSVLLNTEIYHCLASSNTNTKRQVVEKTTLNMVEKKYYKVVNEQHSKIKTMNHRKINLDKGLFKFSFTDIFLMKDILAQIGQEREYIPRIKAATSAVAALAATTKEQKFQENEFSSMENMDFDAESISFYLINNCSEAFIPILRVHVNNMSINKCNTHKKDLLKGNFETSAFYFNSSIFKWEPMLERVEVSASKLIYREEQLNVFSSFEVLRPLTVNISKQLVVALRETLNQWTKKSQAQKHELSQKQPKSQSPKKLRNIGQTIELVSQYVIRNQIGYPIEVYNHSDRKLIYKIDSLTQVDYEYELEKYDDESEIRIIIGIDIVHPKLKFKRITNISLGLDLNFTLRPEIVGKNRDETLKLLPMNSVINFITQTKQSKRYLILKSSKRVQNYLLNRLEIINLPFDHKETLILNDQFHEGREVSLYKNGEKDKYRYFGQGGTLKIMGKALVYNYTPIPLQICGYILLPDQFLNIYSVLTINNMHYKDCRGVKVDYNQKTKTYYIYCEGYIIDYAGLYFEIEEGKAFSHEIMKNGIRTSIYILPSSEDRIKVRLQKKLKSVGTLKCSALIKPAVGNQVFQLQNHTNSLCQYQTYGYLSSYTGNEYKDFKKIIEVTPFYVLSNTTNYKVKVCQVDSRQSVTLEPGERVPFFWENKSKPQLIKIAALKEQFMWGYSGPLSISHNTHSFVVRNSADVSDYRILSLQIENTDTINFVNVIDCHPKKGNNIMLCNRVKGVTLSFYQTGIFEKDYQMLNPQQYVFIVRHDEQLPFGYEIPEEKHEINMDLVFDDDHPVYAGARCSSIILKNIQNNLFEQKIDIYTKDKKRRTVLLKLSFEGNVKKLQLMQIQQAQPEIKQGEFICKIPTVVVSLIGYNQKVRKQIVHAVLTGIEIETASTNKITEYVFTIRQLQIENCLKNHPIFPVIFLSTVSRSALFFLQFMLVKDNFNSRLIHYIGVALNKFIISITSEEIQSLQQNVIEIMNALKNQVAGSGLQNLREYQLFRKPSSQFNSDMYFIEAEIHPLKCNVTFKHVNNWGGRIIRTLASIDDCNLSVAGKKITHFSSKNISDFLLHLQKHYQEGISKIIFPMIGNLSILGNPVSLFQRMSSGFKDLIELPSQGFNVSPLQGTKGLAKGAGSFVKNTFEGAFNSFQSVTGSVGNGLSSLVFDEEFSRERQKIQSERSQHIGQGLANGAKSIANGVAKGITGLVTAPVQGAQESGIGGFFLGGLKGLTGLVVKPVSGLFDATTKTFQGIKNTPSYFDKKGESMKRKRNPRPFYGYNREFKLYDEDIAVCAKFISELDQQKFENLSWYGVYHLVSEQKKQRRNPLLLVTYEYIIIHNLADNNIIQKYRSEDVLDAVYESPTRVKMIIFHSKAEKIGHIIFDLRHANGNKLTNQLKAICNGYRPVYGFDYELFDRKEVLAKSLKSDKNKKSY